MTGRERSRSPRRWRALALLVPLALDPLTVHDDSNFVDTLAREKNLPKEVADHVTDLF